MGLKLVLVMWLWLLGAFLAGILATLSMLFPSPAHAVDWNQGGKTVAAAGTAEQLDSLPINACVVVKALSGNTGDIFLSNTKTRAETSGLRFTMAANDKLRLCIPNLNLIWVNVSVNGEGVEHAVETP